MNYKFTVIIFIVTFLITNVFIGSQTALSMNKISEDLFSSNEEEWTFKVGKTSVSDRSVDDLCGLVIPENWWRYAEFDTNHPTPSLPPRFDWRDRGGVTPIKNQGHCGSCWAFATVGPLESMIKINDGKTVDLSEQWLVSCTNAGSCRGGWWAHDFHVDPGAVPENEFPYVAYDADCGEHYTHPYKISDWKFVDDGGNHNTVPSVDAIKNAIKTYGPISVAVTVDETFKDYESGVFNHDTSYSPNHAVVLVGWNDNQGKNGVWILRNSWGTGWGEDGYMRIEYGRCRVGYSANFIVYQNTPANENVRLTVEMKKITNDPNEGDFYPIDKEMGRADPPEWFYRINIEYNNGRLYQDNRNQDGEGNYISEYTWNVNKEHDFDIKHSEVNVSITLKDNDPIISDIADISPIDNKRNFEGVYNITTDRLDESKSDPFETETIGGEKYYAVKGNEDKNAKVWFKITDEIREGRNIKQCPTILNFLQSLRIKFPQLFVFLENL